MRRPAAASPDGAAADRDATPGEGDEDRREHDGRDALPAAREALEEADDGEDRRDDRQPTTEDESDEERDGHEDQTDEADPEGGPGSGIRGARDSIGHSSILSDAREVAISVEDAPSWHRREDQSLVSVPIGMR